MRLIHISMGNLPSRRANSIQTMRMAESFSRIVTDFRLLTQTHWAHFLLPKFDHERWYAVRDPFPIVRFGSWRAPLRGINQQSCARGFVRRPVRYAQREQADLVFTRLTKAACRAVKMGLWTVCEQHEPPTKRSFRHIAACCREEAFVGLVTITQGLAAQFRDVGMPPEKILVCPDAVDLPAFGNLPDRNTARRRLELDTGRFLVVYSGHLYEKKGVFTLIQAAQELPDMDFLFLGGFESDISKCKAAADGARNIHFPGFVSYGDVPMYLAAADACVLPNSARHAQSAVTSPLKLFEYMAAERPIIASDLPVFSGHLANDRNCRLFTPDDPTSLAEQLRFVAGNHEQAAGLACQARIDVIPHTWDNRAAKILEFCQARCEPLRRPALGAQSDSTARTGTG